MDIGIDLGTTYSVIAVKGQVELTAGYPAGTYLPECDVTIIPTPDGDSTFPSVLWIDPDDPAVVLVGQEAKQKAEEGDCPIMFAKRSIGTNEPLPLGDRTLTAREVAKHVLAHLKACAERALGEPVRRAVITHPAYFDLSQIDETRKAAIDAGFDMADPGQMMMEPAAAALAYLHADPRDPLRILTYDLGGGTFDVTVLERNQGVISLKAYDGNHLLGGYNFDRAFVEWLRGRLEAQGRVVPYNEHDPADRARRARLLQLAEQVKIRLSQQRNDKVYIPVSDRQILEDEQGRPIQIEERINCADYTALIRELLDETIARCHSALAKAALEAADLDAVLLVGGSTYAKWVVDTVSAAFEVDVDPFNPNLCVAAGAALQAADLPGMTASAGFQMRIDTPRESPLPTINFGGVVRGAEGRELTPEECGALQAILTTPEGVTTEPVGVSPSGRFVFEGLTLLEDDPSLFRIQLLDASGAPALSAEHSITYAPESSGTTEITSVLPKPLYLKTDPLTVMAEEGVTLPARCEVRLQRLHTRPIERIAVLQQNDPEPVGHILVEGIPPEAGEGRRMVIQVEINQHRQIRGTATVYGPHDNVVITAPVQLELPAVKVPTLPELQERFGELEARRQQEVVFSQDPQARLVLGGKGRKLSERIQALLAEMEPDKQEVNELVREL
ncbi:MAG: Hsp70 family protein, partial [Armatimonadetes bacterium]|nr:Hsp70 family protein [Armatimonadota bacterium]